MTAPNDVAALVERLRKAQGRLLNGSPYMRLADVMTAGVVLTEAASALEASEAKIAALTSENATAWQMFASEAEKLADEMELNLSLEAKVATQASTIAALQAEVERAKEDSARLDWLERNSNAELAYEGWEESVWQVHTVNGGRNDREWTLRAEGQTVREAIDAARSASRKENTP